jgi:hypothetical protein
MVSTAAASAGSAWIKARGTALTAKSQVFALKSRKAASVGTALARARAEKVARATREAAIVGGTVLATRSQALALQLRKAASAGSAWTRVKAEKLARVSCKAAVVGGSALTTKSQAFALQSRRAVSIGSAWTTAKTRTVSRATSKAAASGLAWTLAKGQTLARQSRQGALTERWASAEASVLAKASLATMASAASWMRARAGGLAQTVHDGHAMASPRIRAALDTVYARLWTLSAEARRIAERQGEQAAFLAVRLNAQAKGEIDALKRAVREGVLTPPWRKVASVAFFRNGGANEHKLEDGPSGQQGARRREMP